MVAISVTNPIVTVSSAADRASPGPPSRSASPAPQVQQQPTANNNNIIQQPNNNIILQQQAPTTINASPVPQIIPKLEPGTTCLVPPQFKVSSVPNSQQHNQRNSISPAPNPQLQVAQQPHRPNSAPVPGHLMENPPEYVPFTLNREVPSFLVSFTPPAPPETPATSASAISKPVAPSTTPTPPWPSRRLLRRFLQLPLHRKAPRASFLHSSTHSRPNRGTVPLTYRDPVPCLTTTREPPARPAGLVL